MAHRSFRLGIIARCDLTGLGIQSRNWVRLLDPEKVIVINSEPFNNNEQHFEWYSDRQNAYVINGFIDPHEINPILDNIDVLLSFEAIYNYDVFRVARERGIKTILQNNWEFTDYLRQPYLPMPDLLVNHSYWNLDKQQALFPEITEYCATPLFIEDYESIYTQNMSRTAKKKRFLHIAGRKTYEDRNGTSDLLEAIKLIPYQHDFELIVKTQSVEIPYDLDPRVIIDRTSPVDEKELYRDFDAMILPRKYAGACLPMNEALASGLPVIMTDIDPNNKVLPKEWLVPANYAGSFFTRTQIDFYTVDRQLLANKIIEFVSLEDKQYNIKAREIAIKEYSSEAVHKKWALLIEKLGV